MNLGAAWTLARFELMTMLKAKETILWIFIMPVVFFFFIGSITSGFSGGSSSTSGTPLLVDLPQESGFLGDHLVERLERAGFRPVLKDTVADPEVYTRRLGLSAELTDSLVAGNTSTLTYTTTRQGIGDEYDTFRINRAMVTMLADMVVTDSLSASAMETLRGTPTNLVVQATQAGFQRTIPSGFSQAVPGTMVMFTLLIMLTSGAVLLVIEREQGLLRRLASAPMNKLTVVGGKWGARIGLGVVQIAFAMVVGTVLFKVTWGPSIPMLGLVLVAYASLCAVLGIFLGSVARSENQAVFLGVLSSNVLAALGGCWWPIEVTPPWMQQFALFLPTGQAMHALHRLVSFGAPPAEVLPHVGILLGLTIVFAVLAARRFRFH